MDFGEILEYPDDLRRHYIKCIKACPNRNFQQNKWYFLSDITLDVIDGPIYLIYNEIDRNYYTLSQKALYKYFLS